MQDAFTSATATCAADNVDIFTVRAPPKPQINLSARVLAMMSRCNLTFLSSGAGQGERCSSANCLAAASHVMLMHGNCTAHSTWPLQARTPNRWLCRWIRQGLRHLFDMAHSAWPLQAVEFQLLEAVSCPCQVRRETPEKRSAFSPPFLAFPQHDTRFCPCQDLDIAALPQRSHRAGITLNCRSVGRVVALLP